jgi:hypothetical protein
MTSSQEPGEYVAANEETLVKIIRHSSSTFPRALALAALVEYGDGHSIEAIKEEIERIETEEI